MPSGKVPPEVSCFMAGGSLTALSMQVKAWWCTGHKTNCCERGSEKFDRKMLVCAVIINIGVIDDFEPIQFGMACPMIGASV